MTVPIKYRWLAVAIALAALTGCPQMFVYVPEGAESILPTQTTETSTPGVASKPVFSTVSVLGGEAAPISAALASYSTDQLISLSTSTEAATIYYTLDGSDPDPYSAQILIFDPSSPIDAARGSGTTLHLKAIALAPQMYPSEVADVQVGIDYLRVSTPGISPAAGTQSTDFQIALTVQDAGAQIWYTLSFNGSEPADPTAASGTQYIGPISVSGNGEQRWIKAIAVKDQMLDSFVAQATYLIQYPTAALPVFSPPTGLYADGGTVSITTATPGAQIWYTRSNGGPPPDPVPGSANLYGGPIALQALDGHLWIRAVAAKSQMLTSPVAFADYIIYPNAPAGLTVGSPTVDSLTVGWSSTPGGSTYRLYRDTSLGGAFTDLAYQGTAVSVVDNASGAGLASGTTYYYKVQAVGPTGEGGPPSAAVGGETLVSPPQNVAASDAMFPTKVRIMWNASTGATDYEVFRSTSAAGVYSLIGTSGGSLYYDDFTPGSNYYKVRGTGTSTSDYSAYDAGSTGTTVVVYMRSTVGQPWGQSTNEAAMDLVFGTGLWVQDYYETTVPATLFATAGYIFMEGGDNNAVGLASFLSANLTQLEAWVNAGGRLFINSAPNPPGGSMSWGFGGTNLVYDSAETAVSAAVPAHPIFQGPHIPVTASYTGSSYAHAHVTGSGLTDVIVGGGGAVFSEKAWGSGYVLFGGMTTTNFHSPAAEAANLRANMLEYLITR